MSGSETVSRRRRRSFSPEFMAEVVALCHLPGRNVPLVSQELGLSETAVRRWFNQAEIDDGARAGTTSAEAQELARVRRQLREVTEERDILARAVSFFAKGTR